MELRDYFENQQGVGVLSTADSDGNVNSAIYARPHVMDDGTLAVIMRDRLSHHNLQTNPRAAYLFIEDAPPGFKGKRFHLEKIKEEQDQESIQELRRRCSLDEDELNKEAMFLVYFRILKELPLIGRGQ
ncbi:MAG: pyridoxamine 5'-phosphate oxidase family protein [Thermodesulfobacteriota bacterium]